MRRGMLALLAGAILALGAGCDERSFFGGFDLGFGDFATPVVSFAPAFDPFAGFDTFVVEDTVVEETFVDEEEFFYDDTSYFDSFVFWP